MAELQYYSIAASLFFFYTISLAIYRLYLSPLSKFPGPKLAALTQWYEIYYNIILPGQFTWEIKRMHERYGPIVRINPYELHIDDPDYYDELYSTSKRRDKYLWFVRGGGSPTSIFETTSHTHHRLRRSALNHFFSRRSISSLSPFINLKISNLCALLSSHQIAGKPIDLRVAFCSLTLDIISDVCFGKDFGLLGDEEKGEEWAGILKIVFSGALLLMHFPWLLKIMNLIPGRWAGPVIRHHRNTRTVVSKILSHEDEKDPEQRQETIFHELRDSDLPPEEKTLQRLADEGNILIGAGSETTASILAVLFFHLLDNPPILERLREELETVEGEFTWGALEKLPYLTAVLSEALRISSAVTTRLPRISPNEEMQFQDWIIPAGTPVSMSYYFIHHNPAIFPSPSTFDPSRWLPNSKPDSMEMSPYKLQNYLVPFSKGSRMCIGMNLAYAELYLTTAILVNKFDLELYETDRKDVDMHKDGFVAMPVNESKGVRVKVKSVRD